ncbi:AraC family transcriptional regulator [Sansalvadorimonas sp. 2012CJ34-2]|uniref:AraC family transcriptional regulator n=1 Tax=Parendozoicomonas callyspongiae TaxID=2942213 RepID=A0ABT0PHQ1_9GAMM|nr:AraC family transcriptional regulator [Sansalvadorimonas sp. 2012CJ34-2]MCL6270865.1 AraC family transcriptional regulator [Sansalvadorimonas sp. 2012CJ34-2]
MIDPEQARTIANIFVRSALVGVIHKGIDCRPLLEQADVPADVLENPERRVEPEAYSRLVQVICRELNDEFFGLSGSTCPPGAFAMMVQACITCASLGDALKRSQKFFSMVAPSFRYSLDVHGEEAIVSVEHIHPGELDDHFLVESLLICIVRWSSWIIGRHLLLNRVDFCRREPRDVDEYNLLFPCLRNYEQPVNRVIFSSRYLDMPVVQDARALDAYLTEVPGNLLTRYRHDDSISAHIRRRLENMSYEDLPSFEDIAFSLNMSTQTLRRRLKAEGNSYREIKDSIRRDIAVYHLLRQDLSINEIAEATGFAEPSTFHRAFKKWTGLTPGAWRDERQVS